MTKIQRQRFTAQITKIKKTKPDWSLTKQHRVARRRANRKLKKKR